MRVLIASFLLFACVPIPSASIRVEYYAPFLSNGGYASEARGFAMGLFPFTAHGEGEEAPLELACMQHGDAIDNKMWGGMVAGDKQRLGKLMRRQGRMRTPDVVVCHSEPGAWTPARYSTAPCPGVYEGPGRAGVIVGRTMFETDRLPAGWADRLNKMDFVWVPTEFSRDVFEAGGVSAAKLVVVGESVDTAFFSRARVRAVGNTLTPADLFSMGSVVVYVDKPQDSSTHAQDPFVFLSVFKWEERKNWRCLIKAFALEFRRLRVAGSGGGGRGEGVREPHALLVLKVSGYHHHKEDKRFHDLAAECLRSLLERTIAGAGDAYVWPEIRIVSGVLGDNQMAELYEAAHAFVMTSRGEGWGRPHVEAMSMELPLISTFWSGPTAFMTADNSYPVPPGPLVAVEEGAFKGHMWADPSVQDVRAAMRQVVSDYETGVAQQKGRRARALMEEEYCVGCVGRKVMRTLQAHVQAWEAQHGEQLHEEL